MIQPDFFSLFLHPLNSIEVPYMITGAVASTIYGEPRLTQDIDIVLDLDRNGVPRLATAFPPDQYYVPPEEALEEEVGRPSGGHFNLLHLETGLRADCYLAVSIIHESIRSPASRSRSRLPNTSSSESSNTGDRAPASIT
jgi:hypothetical protein